MDERDQKTVRENTIFLLKIFVVVAAIFAAGYFLAIGGGTGQILAAALFICLALAIVHLWWKGLPPPGGA
jgi:hypothetical protein